MLRNLMMSFMGLLVWHTTQAEVLSSSVSGFEVQQSFAVHATPVQVWQTLIHPELWWLAEHTWSGKAGNLSLDPKAGGCFCERLPSGSVQHLSVVYSNPGKLLRMTGALGPLQEQALTGVMSIDILMGKDGSQVTMSYRVAGYSADGVGKWSQPVDEVLAAQWASLNRYLVAHTKSR